MNPLSTTRAMCAGHSRYTAGCVPCARQGNRYNYARGRDVAQGRPRLTPDLGSRRRLQALARDGWSLMDLAPRLGVPDSTVTRWRAGNRSGQIRLVNADRVRVVFDELAGTVGPSPLARTQAARAGWAPCLAWMDPDNSDEIPDPGWSPPPANQSKALVEDAVFLASTGVMWATLAARLGVQVDSARGALKRAHRDDVVAALDLATYGPPSPLTHRDTQPRDRDRRKDAA